MNHHHKRLPFPRPIAAARMLLLAMVGLGFDDTLLFGQLMTAPKPRVSEETVLPAMTKNEALLSDLGIILGNSASKEPLELNLCFAADVELSEFQIARGAAVTQALALRAGYRPVHVSHGSKQEPDKFNIIIGTVDDLGLEISPSEAKRIEHGYLALRKLRGHHGYSLVIAGKTLQDVDAVILSLGLVREKLPPLAAVLIKEVILPDSIPFYRRSPLEPNSTLTFGELQENGATVTSLPKGGTEIEMFFPGYLKTGGVGEANVDLHFGHQQKAFRTEGGVKMMLNGAPIAVGPPRQTGTGAMENSVKFPVSLFKPGRNTLTISAGSDFQLYEDSSLTLPEIEGGPELPDLSITSRTFYPFVGQPDGSEICVLLGGREPEVIDSAWTLLARLAQSSNTFFYAAQFTYDAPEPHRHVVVVGSHDQLPPAYRKLVALDAFDQQYVATPADKIGGEGASKNLKYAITSWLKIEKKVVQPKIVEKVNKPTHNGEYAYLACHPPINEESGWVLVLTTKGNDQNLLERTKTLMQPEIWDQIKGDIVRWKAEPASFEVHKPNENNHPVLTELGNAELLLGEELSFYTWVGLIAGLLILCVIQYSRVLGKYDQMLLMRQRSFK